MRRLGEVDGFGVQTGAAEGAEQGAGSVDDEDPGQGDAGRHQSQVAGEARVAGGPKGGDQVSNSVDEAAHAGRSVAECLVKGWASCATMTLGVARAEPTCSTGTGRPARPVATGAALVGKAARWII